MSQTDHQKNVARDPKESFAAPSREEINSLPIASYSGAITLVRTREQLDEALCTLSREALLGFDTEARPTFTKGKTSSPALVQLAAEHTVFVIQLVHVPFNDGLAAILANSGIVKAGVAVRDDLKALMALDPFEPASCTDIAALARARGYKAQGLRSLAAMFLNIRVSKSVQCSNWEKPTLTPRQIAYAATDAWVSRELYKVLA